MQEWAWITESVCIVARRFIPTGEWCLVGCPERWKQLYFPIQQLNTLISQGLRLFWGQCDIAKSAFKRQSSWSFRLDHYHLIINADHAIEHNILQTWVKSNSHFLVILLNQELARHNASQLLQELDICTLIRNNKERTCFCQVYFAGFSFCQWVIISMGPG